MSENIGASEFQYPFLQRIRQLPEFLLVNAELRDITWEIGDFLVYFQVIQQFPNSAGLTGEVETVLVIPFLGRVYLVIFHNLVLFPLVSRLIDHRQYIHPMVGVAITQSASSPDFCSRLILHPRMLRYPESNGW